jgi:hypothetical protein
MPFQNAFNVGHDVAITFNLPTGSVQFAILTDFSSKRISKWVESHGIDGVCRYRAIPGGYEGKLTIDRASPALDLAIATLDQLYYSGAVVPPSTIDEVISELDGSTTSFQFTEVDFDPEDLGSWKGDSKISQTLAWKASFRNQV